MLIHSIYQATEGEGIFVGRPQIFVRFQGCKVACRNCDSKETWAFKGQEYTLGDVLGAIKVISTQIKTISITGGDPLDPIHHESVLSLCKSLKSEGYYINIEAAGNILVPEIFQLVDFISFDFKTPSTGVKTPIELIQRMRVEFPGKFQIKAVIETEEDFNATFEAYQTFSQIDFPWCLTPAYNPMEQFPMERFVKVLEMNEHLGGPFRVIGQQHKWVFGPNKRNK
jgi:7-carboxy-7-deazaguanine synthase